MKRNDEAGRDFRIDRHLSRGGVGYYPHPGFIHVDVGLVRHWSSLRAALVRVR